MQNKVTIKLERIKALQRQRWEEIDEFEAISSQMKAALYGVLLGDPENTAALINLGVIYCDAGDYETALRYLLQAKNLNASDENLFINLGIVSIYLQEPEEKYAMYFNEAKTKKAGSLTFTAYFDAQAH